jgi:hypothetical protein
MIFNEVEIFPLSKSGKAPVWARHQYWSHAADYMRAHLEIPIIATIIYLIVVFGIKALMNNREGFVLKPFLIVWNCFLAIFSMVGVINTLPYNIEVISKLGFSGDMCNVDSEYASPWVFLFCVSKLPEFMDSVLLVLRKRPLIFLHWYHHIATMWFCWIAWAVRLENGGAFAVMNLIVHSFMYSYYAAAAAGQTWTFRFRKSITTIQITQMVMGIAIILHNILVCNTKPFELYFGFFMYLSYAILFMNLYYKNYVSGQKRRTEQQHQRGDVKNGDGKTNHHDIKPKKAQ